MQSLRSKFVILMLRLRQFLKFRFKIRIIDWDTSIPDLRIEIEKSADVWGKLPRNLHVKIVDIDGLNAEWLVPETAEMQKVILYFHGGGLVVGSARSHRAIVAKFVQESKISALTIDYALAPEKPYPEGLKDCIKAYEFLLTEGYEPENIAFMGDSGGGNLVLASLLYLKKEEMPLPAAAVTLSPWTDLHNNGDSWISNAQKDNLCWRDAQNVFSRYYAGDHDLDDPLISPLKGDLQGLPPLLIFAGENELMRDDAVRFAEKAENSGVDVTLQIGKGLFHCYPACSPLFPEAKSACKEIGLFLKNNLR
ncbi:alpha/beta hydrolase [Candidatus Cloacimonadota bacterium]